MSPRRSTAETIGALPVPLSVPRSCRGVTAPSISAAREPRAESVSTVAVAFTCKGRGNFSPKANEACRAALRLSPAPTARTSPRSMRCGLSARSSVSERSGTPCKSDKVSSKCPEVSASARYAPRQSRAQIRVLPNCQSSVPAVALRLGKKARGSSISVAAVVESALVPGSTRTLGVCISTSQDHGHAAMYSALTVTPSAGFLQYTSEKENA